MPPSTISSVLGYMAAELGKLKVGDPVRDAKILICHAFKDDPLFTLDDPEREISSMDADRIKALIERRMRRESMARILGERLFWGLPFGLNEATLDPRPDSETLIRIVLAYFKRRRLKKIMRFQLGSLWSSHLRILDLGTGSGCLLLSLLKEIPDATGLGLDLSPRAIEQAILNASHLGLQKRAAFKVNNWLDHIDEKFDVIISNPPYIKSSDVPKLMPTIRDFDPPLALIGGDDGLDAYQKVIPELSKRLNPGGLAVFEIGYDQAKVVGDLFEKAMFSDIHTHLDSHRRERAVSAYLHAKE